VKLSQKQRGIQKNSKKMFKTSNY